MAATLNGCSPVSHQAHHPGCRCKSDPPSCIICGQVLTKGRAVFTTSCGHSFHYACLQPLYLSGMLDCPACTQIVAEPPGLLQDRTINDEWFFGDITREDAERVLQAHGEDGIFLVRESRTQPGQYCLSFCNEKTRHCRIFINERGEYYLTTTRSFKTLADLIYFYTHTSALHCVGSNSNYFRLKIPCKVRLEDLPS
eukprot:comp19736_c0_seq1/m.23534 comp19736_c0_seq1/g.23534  ORF comp19736_c0_seq1/g.23534 comp19736_c0_seq1/m.23534 type:complete len:197 (-) comp19736_c0_seq1:14-604(-)